jgi:hypothetical protein
MRGRKVHGETYWTFENLALNDTPFDSTDCESFRHSLAVRT